MQTVLIIEDIPSDAAELKRLLESSEIKLEVITLEPGKGQSFLGAAIEICQGKKIGLIFLGRNLTDGKNLENGFIIAQKIKGLEEGGNIPIILTGEDPESLYCSGQYRDFLNYNCYVAGKVIKAFAQEEIEEIVKKFLGVRDGS